MNNEPLTEDKLCIGSFNDKVIQYVYQSDVRSAVELAKYKLWYWAKAQGLGRNGGYQLEAIMDETFPVFSHSQPPHDDKCCVDGADRVGDTGEKDAPRKGVYYAGIEQDDIDCSAEELGLTSEEKALLESALTEDAGASPCSKCATEIPFCNPDYCDCTCHEREEQ